MKFINSLEMIELLQLWSKPLGKYIPFKLWPIQRKLVSEYLHKYLSLIVLKKRQVGGSQLIGADSLIQCLLRRNFSVLVTSITAEDAKVFLGRIQDMYRLIPKMKETKKGTTARLLAIAKYSNAIQKGGEAGETMKWLSGSEIVSLSAKKGRGRTADRVILDECAHYNPKNSQITLKEVKQGIFPTVERAKGQVIQISTGFGFEDFQKDYQRGKDPNTATQSFFIGCWDDPEFTLEQREELERTHGKDHVNQEYPRNDREAFLSSGNPRFELSCLENIPVLPVIWRGHILGKDSFEPNTRGDLRIFQHKIKGGQYMIVADVSEGLDCSDYSCAKVYDRKSQEQVAEWHGHIEYAAFGRLLGWMGIAWNLALLVVEANNHGHGTLTQIVADRYPIRLIFEHDVLSRVREGDVFNQPGKRWGWRTTGKTKPIIIDFLAQMLLDGDILGLTLEDKSELQTYIKKGGKTEAERGCYDDRVMVLAIAGYLMGNETFQSWYPLLHLQDWQTCGTCNYCRRETINAKKGVCRYSKFEVDDRGRCTLWEQFDYDMDYDMDYDEDM